MDKNLVDISIDIDGIVIDGKHKIMLCASLFYFRMPRAVWQQRIDDLLKTGYNTADVYFPWNYHETEKNVFDFSGEKDVEAFLEMCAKSGLYVVARFGPYVCSEWNGGGIPAWAGYESKKIRTTDSVFLSYALSWYEQIVPRIAKYQASNGGTVIMAQLENELDFFDCDDVENYIDALRRKAKDCGLTVPLFCCAGQGDAARAGSLTEGIVPAYNFYPDISSRNFDGVCRLYGELMHKKGFPFLVTETGRQTSLLKRELMAGAKFLGAYNQVAGSNFGYNQSINNWGKPVAIITTKYDFDSLIDTLGYFSDELGESRLFAAMLDTFDEGLSRANVSDKNFTVTADFALPDKINCLELYGGTGLLVCIANLSGKEGGAYIPELELKLRAEPLSALILPVNVSFDGGIIEKSNYEVYSLKPLILYGTGEPDITLRIAGERFAVSGSGIYGGTEVTVLPRAEMKNRDLEKCGKARREIVNQKSYPVKTALTGAAAFPAAAKDVKADCSFEANGIWRGGAVYGFEPDANEVMFYNAADFVTVYDGSKYCSTVFATGRSCFYKFESGYANVRCEKWGASNFDDPRERSLRIKSTKGVENFYSVVHKLSPKVWQIALDSEWLPDKLEINTDIVDALTDLNSYNTTRMPFVALYYTYIKAEFTPENAEKAFICIEGGTAECALYIDGAFVEMFHSVDKMLDVTDYLVKKSCTVQILVRKRDWTESAGQAKILYCRSLKVKVSPYGEDFMSSFAINNPSAEVLPLRLRPGEVKGALIDMEKRDCYGVVSGKDYKLTAVYGGRVIARMVAPEWNGLTQSGGSAEQFLIPEGFYTDGKLKLLIESIGGETELNFSLRY